MKKTLKITLVALGLVFFSSIAMAQQSGCVNCPPPPPPAHGGGPGNSGGEVSPGGCAPIDGGATMLVLMGLAYAGYKGRKIVLVK